MELSSFVLKYSIRGWTKKFVYQASNFWCRKLKVEQSNFPWALLKTRVPNLWAFKCVEISSNMFCECSSWILFNLISLIYFICRALLVLGIHLQRYFRLSFFTFFSQIMQIFFSVSINSLLQIQPSLEGAKLIEKMLLEKDFKEVCSFFITLHQIHVLTFFLFFKLILYPFVWRWRALIHNKVQKWMSMNLNLCWKPLLHRYLLSNFYFKNFSILFLPCLW